MYYFVIRIGYFVCFTTGDLSSVTSIVLEIGTAKQILKKIA